MDYIKSNKNKNRNNFKETKFYFSFSLIPLSRSPLSPCIQVAEALLSLSLFISVPQKVKYRNKCFFKETKFYFQLSSQTFDKMTDQGVWTPSQDEGLPRFCQNRKPEFDFQNFFRFRLDFGLADLKMDEHRLRD